MSARYAGRLRVVQSKWRASFWFFALVNFISGELIGRLVISLIYSEASAEIDIPRKRGRFK